MNFLTGSLRVGRLFGINIRVHMLFVLWIGYNLIIAREDWRSELFFLALLFGTVLLHEFGHCFGARAVGGYAEDILMWPLGGLAYAHAPLRPWPQFVTVAAGPLVNVILCLGSAALMFLVTRGDMSLPLNPLRPRFHFPLDAPDWLFYPAIFYRVNLFLLAFNLLPIYPLDGGQLFQAMMWPFLGLQRATLVACQVGLAGCVLFGIWGLRSGAGGMLFFIAIFGGLTCWQRLRAARHGLLVEDPVYGRYNGGLARRGFWSRLFGRKRRPTTRAPVERANPNPGGWAAWQEERAREDGELDRILKKVSERGVQSLSYVERQTLERITRERRAEENQYQSDNRL